MYGARSPSQAELGVISCYPAPMTRMLVASLACVLLSACASSTPTTNPPPSIEVSDTVEYQLGTIAAFAEMVRAGVKPLALGAPLEPTRVDAYEARARAIAAEYDVSVYRERDFLVTDLFPASVTAGKHVLLLYRGDTLSRYEMLKRERAELVTANTDDPAARRDLARRFGQLLGYPTWRIDELLAAASAD